MSGRARSGFTFIEILVVVTILTLLAAVGVIQLQRARIVTYEQLAISSVRLIAKSCQFYYLNNAAQYPASLAVLGAPGSNPPYLDETLAQVAPNKQGYAFTYTQGPGGASFTLSANPQTPGVTGIRSFYVEQDLAIHVSSAGPANSGDPVLP